MRRERRMTNSDNGFKKIMYISGAVLLVAVVAFVTTVILYNNKIRSQSRVSQLNANKVTELVPSISTQENITSASTSIGKTVNEAQEENTVANNVNTTISTNNTVSNQTTNQTTNQVKNNVTDNKNNTAPKVEVKKELKFKMPVEGEIIKEFSKDTLVYSETLKEWITHLGIDIKAEKTSVVKASEEGTVKSIKNDPRYGLTVVVEHENDYKTVYANLLTAEFVSEGEEIKQGQTIGTVGNTAVFESADEPHLHFEILKDGEYVNPNSYIQ